MIYNKPRKSASNIWNCSEQEKMRLKLNFVGFAQAKRKTAMALFSEKCFFPLIYGVDIRVPLKRKDITHVYFKNANFLVLQEKTKEISKNR